MYRCLNDLFGYCSGKPDFRQAGEPLTVSKDYPHDPVNYIAGNQCFQDHHTCGRYQTFAQIAKTK